MREFQMGRELAIVEQRKAKAGAQSNDTFETAALDHTQAVDAGIV